MDEVLALALRTQVQPSGSASSGEALYDSVTH
jgi:hypothetical protein